MSEQEQTQPQDLKKGPASTFRLTKTTTDGPTSLATRISQSRNIQKNNNR